MRYVLLADEANDGSPTLTSSAQNPNEATDDGAPLGHAAQIADVVRAVRHDAAPFVDGAAGRHPVQDNRGDPGIVSHGKRGNPDVIFLSAFADEIAPSLDAQIDVLQAENIRHLDLRTMDDVGVLDLSAAQAKTIKQRLDDAGITVTAIASPIGKAPADVDIDEDLARLDKAIELARLFETPAIRVFSYYAPAANSDADPEQHRAMAVGNLLALSIRAEEAGDMLLLLEQRRRPIW